MMQCNSLDKILHCQPQVLIIIIDESNRDSKYLNVGTCKMRFMVIVTQIRTSFLSKLHWFLQNNGHSVLRHDSKYHEVLSLFKIFLDYKLVLLNRFSSKTEMLGRSSTK